MKKRILFIATAVACMIGFSACQGDDLADLSQLADQLADTDLLGHIHLKASAQQNGTGGLQNHEMMTTNDSILFKSGVCCAKVTVSDSSQSATHDVGAMFFGSTSSVLVNENHEIQFPLIGINLRDSLPGDYTINIPMTQGDFNFIDDLNENNWRYYLTHNDIQIQGVDQANMMVIAPTDSTYYICYQGTIHISEFPVVGQRVKGSVNVQAFYITNRQVELLSQMPSAARANINLPDYLPTVTLNGVFESPRMNSENLEVINTLDNME